MCYTQQGREPADVLTTLYNRYVKQCIEYVLTGVLDGVQAEKLRQVMDTSVASKRHTNATLYQYVALTAVEQSALNSVRAKDVVYRRYSLSHCVLLLLPHHQCFIITSTTGYTSDWTRHG
jgi:hypothetical protein